MTNGDVKAKAIIPIHISMEATGAIVVRCNHDDKNGGFSDKILLAFQEQPPTEEAADRVAGMVQGLSDFLGVPVIAATGVQGIVVVRHTNEAKVQGEDKEPPSYYDIATSSFTPDPRPGAEHLSTSAEIARENKNVAERCRRCGRTPGSTYRLPCGDCADYSLYIDDTGEWYEKYRDQS